MSARAWTTCAGVGLAALLGVEAPVDKALDAIFATLDAQQRRKARELSTNVGALMQSRAHSFPAGTMESARATTEDALRWHGLSDADFAALDLDAEQAADVVLGHARMSRLDQTELEPRVRELLVCFYDALPENKDLLPDLLPHIHRESLKRLGRIEADTTKISAKQNEQSVKLDRLLALAEAGGVFERAAERGIPEKAVRAIVERLGGEGIGRDDLIPWLDKWIEAAVRELGKRTNEDEAFEAARREAEARFRQGRLGEASAAFMDELVREEQEEQERQEERKRRRLRLLEEAIRFDELAFDGEAAAKKLRMMAKLEGNSDSDALGKWLFDKAGEFYERGDKKGENAALLVAIAAYREALGDLTRERVPLQWAATQNNLGNALLELGRRESGTARLEEAVAAYRAGPGGEAA